MKNDNTKIMRCSENDAKERSIGINEYIFKNLKPTV